MLLRYFYLGVILNAGRHGVNTLCHCYFNLRKGSEYFINACFDDELASALVTFQYVAMLQSHIARPLMIIIALT